MPKLSQKQEIRNVAQSINDSSLLENLLEILLDLVKVHQSMRGAYFYTPPINKSGRRNYEERYSRFQKFNFGGYEYTIDLDTSCSCKNVYYSAHVSSNSPWTDNMGTISKILDAVDEQLSILTKRNKLKLEMDDVERLYNRNNAVMDKSIDLPRIKSFIDAEVVMDISDMWVAPEGHIVIIVDESEVGE